ncbi:Pectinesterase 2.2 [Spatholobus suberectus]|nr:Pectinesterase 2.2 [Spatholobus suberectus]
MNSGLGVSTSKRVNWTGYPIITTEDEASQFIVKQLINGDLWLASTGDRSGNFNCITKAVTSAPNNTNTRFIIYVNKGMYKENVKISSEKINVMLVGDGMNATVITSNLNYVDRQDISVSAIVVVDENGFIA